MKKELLRILIIEDNEDHVELLSQVLERHFAPIDLHTVETIEDALDFLDQTIYDTIFIDGYINNTVVTEKIPDLKKKCGDTPVIVITGSGDETLAVEVIKKGASEYVTKNREAIDRIPIIVKKYLDKKHKAKAGRPKDEGIPLTNRLLGEMEDLDRRAKDIAQAPAGQATPDIKQLESLLEQIAKLREMAATILSKK